MENAITLSNVKAGYGARIVLDGVSFTVSPGRILTLLGPNGCGKSTLIKTICGQIEDKGGSIFIGKDDVKSLSRKEIARQLSVMLTERPDPEYMTCREVVEMGRIPYTGTFGSLSDDDKKIVESSMELVDITELSETGFGNISDGQRQRVMLARAIAQEPRVLIMDEPTTFLDIKYKVELLSILKNLVKNKNIAVVLSLHELELAGKISDEVLCINDGRVVAYGATEEIFSGELIQNLYGLKSGKYIESYGSIELSRVKGEPKVFVIAGGGSGIKIYHRLWREDVPFACGVLSENDMEYPIAKELAAEVIAVPAFYPGCEEDFERAKALIDKAERVICKIETFGPVNEINKRLLEYANDTGKYRD